ncbi:cystatin-B-like isoform X1 [Myotis myotis]|uniref:cystatin-B-like isoform X1 n=1 Tax=Myotis myotis TaxID=51298 RepID=UPI00174D2C67|nr:cystatin-B-like isoform X1 [Myotis myotis]
MCISSAERSGCLGLLDVLLVSLESDNTISELSHGQCLEAATCPVPSPAFGSSHHSCFPASTPETGQEGGHFFPDSHVKSQLEEKENKKYPTFKATEYMSQLVAGTNYFIKVQVADDDFVHLRVFQSLPHENKALALDSYQTNKTKQDELAYF